MSTSTIDKVRDLVSSGHMSKAALARAAGLHANTLRDCIEPAWNPTADTLSKLERFLSGVRQDIDAIDDQILALLNRRAAASLEVGRRKSGTQQAVYKPFREKEVLKRLAAENPGPLPTEHLRVIYRALRNGEALRAVSSRTPRDNNQ